MIESPAVGFTGTRYGMTTAQRTTLLTLLAGGRWAVLHHGDCVGADAEAHHAARLSGLAVVIHPPINSRFRANMKGDKSLPPLPYLDRNRAIVASAERVIAAPVSTGQLISGTWYTVRYALIQGKPVSVIRRNGTVMSDEEVRRCV